MASFEIEVNTSKSSTYERMKTAVAQANGEFSGDENSGSFEIPVAVGRISGNYELHENRIAVDIRKKPFLVSMRMIEDALTGFIESEEEE